MSDQPNYQGPILPCPFDGNPLPTLDQSGKFNDGTPMTRVICSVCGCGTPRMQGIQPCIDLWNTRYGSIPSFVVWQSSLANFVNTGTPAVSDVVAWIAANPPTVD